MISQMLSDHGINAKNRFQFKNKNVVEPENIHLTIDSEKQKTDKIPMNINSLSLSAFFNLFNTINNF
jgi:hypothetical protein